MSHATVQTRAGARDQVLSALRQKIESGGWVAGEMIPGRRKLASEYGVALTTIERAISTLMSEGLLRADDRRGTFVTKPVGGSGAGSLSQDLGDLRRGPVLGRVGVVGEVAQYRSRGVLEQQWDYRVLRGVEGRLSGEPGLTSEFRSITELDGSSASVDSIVEGFIEEGVGGLLLIERVPSTAVLAKVVAAHVPLVVAAFDPKPINVPQVYLDSRSGGAAAARHLIVRGYRRLLYFRPFSMPWTEERLAGIEGELETLGLSRDILRVEPQAPAEGADPGRSQMETAQIVAEQVLARGFEPDTGVIAANDGIAKGFMAAAEAYGQLPGRDYGLVGFDDREPLLGLTSLRPPLGTLGEEAARVLLNLMQGGSSIGRLSLRPRLIARSSSYRAQGDVDSPSLLQS